jgi:hypothetical protein
MTTPNWVIEYFNNSFCSGDVRYNDDANEQRVIVKGKIKKSILKNNSTLLYWAANPVQRGISPGSAYPYANMEQAFDRSPNIGEVPIIHNHFEIELIYPSGYYTGLGSILVHPALYIKLKGSGSLFSTIKLGESYPFRTLTYPSDPNKNQRDGPMFYHQKGLPIRSQEAILRASAYPKHFYTPPNFWGLKPAN